MKFERFEKFASLTMNIGTPMVLLVVLAVTQLQLTEARNDNKIGAQTIDLLLRENQTNQVTMGKSSHELSMALQAAELFKASSELWKTSYERCHAREESISTNAIFAGSVPAYEGGTNGFGNPDEWITLPFTNVAATSLIPENRVQSDAEALFRDAKDYGALTNLCDLLVRSGEFCRVRGHTWQANLKGYPAEQADKPEWRECAVCGREEERARNGKPWRWSNAPYSRP